MRPIARRGIVRTRSIRSPVPDSPPSFTMVEVSPEANGPAGALPVDIDGDGWERHEIVPEGDARFFHRGVPVDFDGDGLLDIVTVGEQQEDAEVMWFRTVERGVFSPETLVMGPGGGSMPVVHDVDDDGDLDVGSAEYFYRGASYVWFENTTGNPAEPGRFVRHVMTDELGWAIELAVIPDLLADGADGWVGSNHVNTVVGEPEPRSVVSLLTPPSDPPQVRAHRPISQGIR